MPAKIIACPSCGKKFKLPAGSSPDEFQCTGCGEVIELAAPAGRGQRPRGGGRRRQPQSSNQGIILGLGVVGLVVVVAVVGIVVMGGDEKKDPVPTATNYQPAPVREHPPVQRTPPKPPPIRRDPVVEPEPTREPEPGREPTREPEPEPEPKKTSDIRMMSWPNISAHVAAYGHLESTPAGTRAEIDKLVITLMDFQSGRDGLDAKDRLVDIGKPAVPMLLKAVGPLEFKEIPDKAAGALVDEALRSITRHTRGIQLRAMMEDPRVYIRVFKYHVAWWERRKHLEGDLFPEPLQDEPMDPKEDEDEDK